MLIRSSGESVEQYRRARRTRQHAEILFSASDDASYVTGAPLVCSIMGMFPALRSPLAFSHSEILRI